MDTEMLKTLIETAMWMIGGLVGTLVLLVGWIGARVHGRLDSMATSLVEIKDELKEELSAQKEALAAQRSELAVQKERVAVLYSTRRKTDFEGDTECSH